MSDEERQLIIRRILVALDTSTDSLAALTAAAEMASAMHAELVGLFVEDVNLIRLANLPFANEIMRATGLRQSLNQDSIEHDLQLQASQARRALAEVASRAELEWEFKVVRGVVKSEVLNAALDADLLSLGRTSHRFRYHHQLGSTAREAVRGARRPVLLGQPHKDLGGPVFITFDGSLSAEQALLASAEIAAINDSELVVVFVLSPEREESSDRTTLANQCEEILGQSSREPDLNYEDVTSDDIERLAALAQDAHCSVLVLGGENPSLKGDKLQFLLDELSCPVMVIR